jgi:hypothetical protein
MFENRFRNFVVPGIRFHPHVLPTASAAGNEPLRRGLPLHVQIGDIYQAARNRAIEEHEIDKLFNPHYYGDDQI